MNDYGVFNILRCAVENDDEMKNLGVQIATQLDEDHLPPHVVVCFGNTIQDIPFNPKIVLLECELKITSAYQGLKEIHKIMTCLNSKLEGSVEHESFIFKLIDQKIWQENVRFGHLNYQVRIHLNQGNE